MNTRSWVATISITAMGLALAAFPAPPDTPQVSQAPAAADQASVAQLEKQIAELEVQLQKKLGRQFNADAIREKALEDAQRSLAASSGALQELSVPEPPDVQGLTLFLNDERGSWLGVETQEVTAAKAKDLKLPAERGVIIAAVTPDSPAAKAGLQENDVVTEVDGQQVEGTAQFRRMIREIPAGRTVQLRVYRNGSPQTLQATLGAAEQGVREWDHAAPGTFTFHMPDMPEIPPMPPMEWNATMWPVHPRLGIEAEDLNGQLGAYFGAPDGEGVLVRGVGSGTPAEKAGLRAGDVITAVERKRVRTMGDLREQLAASRKAKSVQVSVLRNKAPLTVTVELPAPAAPKTVHRMGYRTTI